MASFSIHSTALLRNAHPELVRVMYEAIKETDFEVLESFRSRALQNLDFQRGRSRARPFESPHDFFPALAVDIAPYPIDWNNLRAFIALNNVIIRCATEQGVQITWGGTFKSIVDMPHYELTHWKDLSHSTAPYRITA